MDFFFKLQRKNDYYKIIKKNTDVSYLDSKITTEYDNLINKTMNITNKDTSYIYNNLKNNQSEIQDYLWSLFDFDIENVYNILSNDFNSNFYITCSTDNFSNIKIIGDIDPKCNDSTEIAKIKNKCKNILYNAQTKDLYEKIKNNGYCEKEALLFNNKLKIIYYLFDFLAKGGNFFLSIYGYCNNQIIELIYILSFMFEYCIIYNSTYIICKNFDSVLKKEDFDNIIDKSFFFEPKYQLNDLIIYFEKNLKYHINKFKLLFANKEDELININVIERLESFKYYNNKLYDKFVIENNKFLIENFKRIFVNNKLIKTSSAINGKEGNFIYNMIIKYDLKKCLEIGMAYGISAFYILSNPETNLFSIDPFQTTQWNDNGINLIKEFKFDKRHKLFKLKSYIALPKILEEYSNNYFDFIFIDGFHTFDYTLLDFFYANLLLKIGGIIIIDDALHLGVSKCCAYITNNYNTFYKKLASPTTFAMYIKIKEDERKWDFHKNF